MSTIREIPDDLWNEIEPLIPTRPPRSNGGRKPADDRLLFNGIFFILRAGAAWREMPKAYGRWSTVYGRFREWRNAKVFEDFWRIALNYYDQQQGIEWEWQSADGTYARSPLGVPDNGPNPTDRGKPGMKDQILTDGRGVPISVLTTKANRNDHLELLPLLNNSPIVRPRPKAAKPQHLCLDAAYDNVANANHSLPRELYWTYCSQRRTSRQCHSPPRRPSSTLGRGTDSRLVRSFPPLGQQLGKEP